MTLRAVLGALLCPFLLAAPAKAAEVGSAGDAPLRVTTILNIIRFVDFGSTSSGGPMLVCVRRGSSAARAIKALSGQRVGMHPIAAREIVPGKPAACDVVYLGASAPAQIARLRQPGVLLIGDGPDFINAGGTIGLVAAGGQIHFEANTQAARQAGLRLSSKLLRLATRIR